MNTLLLSIILIPIIEIYLFIKIGSQIGAFKTIFLIFFTAVVGVYYAKHEGRVLPQGNGELRQMVRKGRAGYCQVPKKVGARSEDASGGQP